jgi:hypothetical protein
VAGVSDFDGCTIQEGIAVRDASPSVMTRILLIIASLSMLALVAALIAGFLIGNIYEQPVSDDTLRWATVHRLAGLLAALGVVFVESIIIT